MFLTNISFILKSKNKQVRPEQSKQFLALLFAQNSRFEIKLLYFGFGVLTAVTMTSNII
jgi:hypothetical protein